MHCLFFCCFFCIVHQHNLGSWFWVTLPALALWLCLWRDRRIGIVGRFAPLRLNALERRRGWNTAENNLEPNLLRPWRNTATHFLWSSAANPLLQARQCLEMPNKVDFRRFSRTWMDLIEPRDNRAQASFSSVNLQKSFLHIWTTIFLDLSPFESESFHLSPWAFADGNTLSSPAAPGRPTRSRCLRTTWPALWQRHVVWTALRF